jgi:hypothetical protein
MPKNLKVLLLIALAVNAVHETDSKLIQSELKNHSRYVRQLELQGVLRIEHRQHGDHLRATLVTEDSRSAFNGLSITLKDAEGFEYFSVLKKNFENIEFVELDVLEFVPQLLALRTVQRTYYDDEESLV